MDAPAGLKKGGHSIGNQFVALAYGTGWDINDFGKLHSSVPQFRQMPVQMVCVIDQAETLRRDDAAQILDVSQCQRHENG